MTNFNTLSSGTINAVTSFFKDGGGASKILPALAAQATKTASAVSALFRFAYAGTAHLVAAAIKRADWSKMASAQWSQAHTVASQAGTAGFVGLSVFALSLIALVAYRQWNNHSNSASSTASSSGTSNNATGQVDFKKLCTKNPAAAKAYLENETTRPPADKATEVLQQLVDGLLVDLDSKISTSATESVAPPDPARVALLVLFFETYPMNELRFVGGILSRFPMAGKCGEAAKLPYFSAIIDHCPGIKDHLSVALMAASNWGCKSFIQKIVEKDPEYNTNFPDLVKDALARPDYMMAEWLTDTYPGSYKPADICWFLSKLAWQHRFGSAASRANCLELFQRLVLKHATLPASELNGLLQSVAREKDLILFSVCLNNLTSLTRESFSGILEDQALSKEAKDLINSLYPAE